MGLTLGITGLGKTAADLFHNVESSVAKYSNKKIAQMTVLQFWQEISPYIERNIAKLYLFIATVICIS